jgi:hypothetical protein
MDNDKKESPKELAQRIADMHFWIFGPDNPTRPVAPEAEDGSANSMRSLQQRLFGKNSPLTR